MSELENTETYGINFLINDKVLDACYVNHLTLDELVFLYGMFIGNQVIELWPASINKLKRSGFLDKNGDLTAICESLIVELLPENSVKPEPKDSRFQEIWLLFPRDDQFRHFPATRPIRHNKPATLAAYVEALKELTHEELMECLRKDLYYRRSSETENLFKYMKGSVKWFKDKAYEEYKDEGAAFYKDDEKFGKELG